MPHFYLAALRYIPGNWQLMASFAWRLLSVGLPVRLLLSPGYRWMNRRFPQITDYAAPWAHAGSSLAEVAAFLLKGGGQLKVLWERYPPAGLLLTAWHPLNFLLARRVKARYPGVPVLAWVHEPYKDDKKIYGPKAPFLALIEGLQSLSLRYTDIAILHSRRAWRLFARRYPAFPGKKLLIPFLFPDNGPPPAGPRDYLTFLGRADRAKGIGTFFSLVEGASRAGLDWRFQIATSSRLEKYQRRLSPGARERLKVVQRPELPDADLYGAAGRSLAVLALYQETTQSAVIPLALMKGTPIIGTAIEGIAEWVEDRRTGVLVSPEPSLEEIQEAVAFIQGHWAELTASCRAAFLDTFADTNWDRHYGWLKAVVAGPGRA